jgi:hypothetical protein
MKALSGSILAIALVTGACAEPPATESLTRPDVPPARLVSFTGTLQPSGINSHAFSVTQAGTVEVTLLGVGSPEVSQPITVGLGIGTVSGGGACLLSQSVSTQGGTRAQIIGTGQEGALCVSIFDVGNLTKPITYTITVAAP